MEVCGRNRLDGNFLCPNEIGVFDELYSGDFINEERTIVVKSERDNEESWPQRIGEILTQF